MGLKKKQYKTKEVNIIKLSAFYDQVRKETKKDKNGKRNLR
jgi:hypothetical protein|tara:strand:- start:4 stop:126 length:123 start_codon:yes stop_codon:yes gene_type:complete